MGICQICLNILRNLSELCYLETGHKFYLHFDYLKQKEAIKTLPIPIHFSTLAVSQLVCKVSIDLLTLAGLSTNISTDRPANPVWCTVSLQTCRPWQVYGQFSDRVDLMSQTC